jgi:hypothetical protein
VLEKIKDLYKEEWKWLIYTKKRILEKI